MRADVMRWMEGLTDEWLLIFDDWNLNDSRGQIPGRNKGNILYTSRSTALGVHLPSDCIFEVTPFQEADAVELLLKRSGSEVNPADPEKLAVAQEIVQELGCLPLAVEQAAISIRYSAGNTLAGYLEHLRKEKVRVLSDSCFQSKEIENPTVYAALEISYNAILATKLREGRRGLGGCANMAIRLLKLLCFYHHKDFPGSIMGRAAKERRKSGWDRGYPLNLIMKPHDIRWDQLLGVREDGEWDQDCFAQGVYILERFSLIKVSPDRRSLSMHVLIHNWARHRMDRETSLLHSQLARIVVTEAIVFSKKWLDAALTRSFRPHIEACYAHQHRPFEEEQYEMWLRFKLGWFHQLEKRFDEAEKCYLDFLHFCRLQHGNHDRTTIAAVETLGSVYHESGRLGEAELMYWEAIGRLEERERDYFATIAGTLKKRRSAPQSTTSEETWKTLSHLVKTPFTRSPERNSEESSDPEFAERLSLLPPPVGTKPQDPLDEPRLLGAESEYFYSHLARVYMDQDRKTLGKRWLLDAVERLEAAMPEGHPRLLELQIMAKSLTDPGNLDYWCEKCDEALAATGEAREMWSDDSDAYWNVMVAVGNALLKNKIWYWAYDFYHSVYKQAFKPYYGRCDKRSLEVLRRMVDSLVEGEKYDEAVEIARECVQRATYAYGELHQETVLAMEKLHEALFYRKMEHDEESTGILQQAVARAEAGLGRTHSLTSRLRSRLKRGLPSLSFDPETLVRDHEELTRGEMPAAWRIMKTHLEKLTSHLGPRNILVKRVSRLVGDNPPATAEEYTERLLACYGPHSSFFATKRAAPVQSGTCNDTEASNSSSPGDFLDTGRETRSEAVGAESLQQDKKLNNRIRFYESVYNTKEAEDEVAERPTTPLEPTLLWPDLLRERKEGRLPDGMIAYNGTHEFNLKNDPVYLCGMY